MNSDENTATVSAAYEAAEERFKANVAAFDERQKAASVVIKSVGYSGLRGYTADE